jgi:hypothetical protein
MSIKSTENSIEQLVSTSTLATVLKVVTEIAKMIFDAIAGGDLETLKKVDDFFPAGHKLRSELTYAAEMEKLRRKLAAEGRK